MRYRLALIISLLIVSCALSVRAVDPPPSETNAQPSSNALQGKLQQLVKVDFVETPLVDVVHYLSQTYDVEIRLDTVALEKDGIGAEVPVTMTLSNVSLRSMLSHLFRIQQLASFELENIFVITTPEAAESKRQARVYSVRNLVELKPIEENQWNRDSQELMDLLTSVISHDTWQDSGGAGSMQCTRDSLVISQTNDVLASCAELLSALERLPVPGAAPTDNAASFAPIVALTGATPKLTAALAKPISLEFEATPLADVAEYLKSNCEIEILIDTKELNEIGIDANVPVTFNCKNHRLDTALGLMLRPLELTYQMRDEVLLITSPEEVENNPDVVLYPVADLLVLPAGAELLDVEREMQSLVNLISRSLTPYSWRRVGGAGQIKPFISRQALVISNTPAVQAELSALLTKMRSSRSELPPLPAAARLNLDEMEVVVYELLYRQIPQQKDQPAPVQPEHINTKELAQLVPKLLGKQVWGDNDEIQIEGLADRLVVKQTLRVHRQIALLLHQMGVGFAGRNPNVGLMQGVPDNNCNGGFIFNLPTK